jgi:glycerol-3-phosphate dehydrogenase (NAD(P)+)
MEIAISNITVLGDGGWGTALSMLLLKNGHSIRLWSAFPDYADILKKTRENTKFLPGFKLPVGIHVLSDIKEAVFDSDVIVLAIPSNFLRDILKKLKKASLSPKVLLVSVVKGFENVTFKRPSEIISDELGIQDAAVLSGPTIAHEVALGLPASAVTAAKSLPMAENVQSVFMSEAFRVYTSSDIAGVELGGALKNIIAIAAGISDGLRLGANAKAALFTRGLVEIKKFGMALGADQETFNGLSGIGDLVTTCISPLSRNRSLGERIASGSKPSDILTKMEMVAEGVETAKSVYMLSKKIGIDMPITEQIYKVLFENKNPRDAVRRLMTRNRKQE